MREASAFLLAAAPWLAVAADIPRPRGVGPEFSKYYKAKDKFTCISNPSIALPLSAINDDFCDCPDGSDEPGTAACAYIHPYTATLRSDSPPGAVNSTHALPGFYCKNKGHQPSYIPFIYVNDGVCDYELCCDGSDEYGGVGGKKCPDKCKEIGKDWRTKDEARQKSVTAAVRRRKELKVEADRLLKEVEDRIGDLKVQVAAAEVSVKDAENVLVETERRERSRLAKGGGKAGRLGQLAGLAKQRVEELRQSLENVRRERDDQTAKVKELEQLLSTFREEYNPNFNDEGVKRAVRAWEEYSARDKPVVGENAAAERDLEEILKADSETEGINWAEWEVAPEENDVEQLYTLSAYLPPFVRGWLETKILSLKELLIANGVIAPSDSASGEQTESAAVKAAREGVTNSQNSLRGLERSLQDAHDDTSKDYGPDGIFRALKGQTVAKDSGEYTYELVWMERTSQKSKKGGQSTNMGNFAGFETVTVDDELPADGKGLGSGERLAMKFENGQHCWNGPHRSTLVVMACAEQDELWKITEEEKCVYRMEVGTAAVCGVDVGKVSQEEANVKDEL